MLNNFFSIPIWTYKIHISESVVQKCYNLASTPSRNISNIGGWQSDILTVDTFPEITEQLEDVIKNVQSDIHENFKVGLDGYWVNFNQKSHYNMAHVHPLSALSGVLYVKCNEQSGNIKLNSNSLREHYPINTFESPLFRDTIEFQPKVGDVLIFPSWIYHSVLPNNSDDARISIAFNLKQYD